MLLDASALVQQGQDAAAPHQFDAQITDMIRPDSSVVVWTKMDLLPPPLPSADEGNNASTAGSASSAGVASDAAAAPSASVSGRAKLRESRAFYERARASFSPSELAHFRALLQPHPAFQLVAQRGAPMVFLACAGQQRPHSSANPATSVESHRGLPQLLAEVEKQIQRIVGLDGAPLPRAEATIGNLAGMSPSSMPLITRARHRTHVAACCALLELFERYMSRGDLVLAAEQLRLATREIGKITGRVEVEELLDVIFADFCIGK